MNFYLWASDALTVFGAQFPAARQQTLLEHAFSCSLPPTLVLLAGPAVAPAAPAPVLPVNGIVAVADRCADALKYVAWHTASSMAHGLEPVRLGTLVLLMPHLDDDFFVITDKNRYKAAALALEGLSRVVVLTCGRDTVATSGSGAVLGRVGLAANSDPRVTAIDISPLIEHHADAAYGALCSCEALGLVRRLLLGAHVEASILGRAQVLGARS